jgi:hypothetical protein
VPGIGPAASPGEKRIVIVGKKKTSDIAQDDQDSSAIRGKSGGGYTEESASLSEDDGMSVEIRDRVFRARDEIFEGKSVRKPTLPQARDSTLLHTELRPKKRGPEREYADEDDSRAGQEITDPASIKKRTISE